MSEADLILYIVVATALVFDFTNGFHDTANVVATSISTRAMSFPAAAAIGALAYGITQLFGDSAVGPLMIAAAGAAMIALAFAHRIRQGTPVPGVMA